MFYFPIICREKFLLYDETVSSFDHKELVIKVIAHELSHQWFGNLVTMEWLAIFHDLENSDLLYSFLKYLKGGLICG